MMRNVNSLVSKTAGAALGLLLLVGSASMAESATLGLDIASGSASPQFNNSTTTFGWVFSISEQKSVTALGVWDQFNFVSPGPFAIGLWSGAGGAPLATATVTNSSTIVSSTWSSGQWLFTDLASPVVLDPGQYVVGAFGNFQFGVLARAGGSLTVQTPSFLTFQGGAFVNGQSLMFPSTWNIGSYVNPAYFGPNLLFADIAAPGDTPIPGALPLFASGLGGLGLLTWRRKRKNAAARAAA